MQAFLDKGFHEQRTVAVAVLEVVGQAAQGQREGRCGEAESPQYLDASQGFGIRERGGNPVLLVHALGMAQQQATCQVRVVCKRQGAGAPGPSGGIMLARVVTLRIEPQLEAFDDGKPAAVADVTSGRMPGMSRIRTYVVGRGCDVRLDNPSVSWRHAELVRVANGRLYVTDCATTNGTFVLAGEEWREVRQAFVDSSGQIRFGDCRMSAARLDALCAPDDGGASGAADEALDPTRGLVFDPETGEVLEKEPPRARRSER